MRVHLKTGLAVLGCLTWFISSGCEKTAAPPMVLAPAEVTVAQPIQQQISDFVEFTGNTDALASVDVRARVKGFLKKQSFTDGAMVKEGDLLFEIEPDTFKAEVDQRQASLEGAQAQLERGKVDLANKQQMFSQNAATQYEVVTAQASVNSFTAAVASAAAQLEQAKINLRYTTINAPMSGRIDRSRVDIGNLVGSDGNTLLANIVQNDPIYLYFDVDERTVQKFLARIIQAGGKPGEQKNGLPIVMALGNSPNFDYKGMMDYVDNRVDAATGTIKVRANVPNPTRALAPGFFARVRVPDGEPYQAVLVPQRAIGVDQGQKYVLVVNDKNVVESRPVETGSEQNRMVVIKKGLSAGEWVITEGILRTRPGATVSPQKKSLSSPTGAPTTSPK